MMNNSWFHYIDKEIKKLHVVIFIDENPIKNSNWDILTLFELEIDNLKISNDDILELIYENTPNWNLKDRKLIHLGSINDGKK